MRRAGHAVLFLVTTLTLTIVAPYRPDPDGGQAPRFFLMPCAPWELGARCGLPHSAAQTGGQEAAYEETLPAMPTVLVSTRPPARPRLWGATLDDPTPGYRSMCYDPPVPPPRLDWLRSFKGRVLTNLTPLA